MAMIQLGAENIPQRFWPLLTL